jgi:DNA-binding transcriptional LysR family regulator
MEWPQRVGRRIRLRDLHILLAVVQCKSMAKAANQLAVSKPVVSKTIADLEQVLGVRLLERDRHGAEPTIYGAALLKRGLTVFDELREGVKDIAYLRDPAVGEVRIGCSLLLAATFVSAVVDRLSRRYPRIRFHLVTTQVEPLYRELADRSVDLLITRKSGLIAADERLSFEFLFNDTYVVVAGVQNPLARRRRVALADLMEESWTLPPLESVPGSVVAAAFPARDLDYPAAAVISAPTEVRLNLVATGRFLTIVSTTALRFPAQRPDTKVLPVAPPIGVEPIGIVTLKNRMISPVAQLLIEAAREIAMPLAKTKK